MSKGASDSPNFEGMPKEQRNFYRYLTTQIEQWIDKHGENHKYADYLLYAPDLLHVMCKLSVDDNVPVTCKAKLAAAIAYFISPVDVVPEAVLGPAGYLDDVAIAAHVLNQMMAEVDQEVITQHWHGEEDLLFVVQRIQETAVEFLGGKIWKAAKQIYNTGTPTTA